jgi:hypothetical protein
MTTEESTAYHEAGHCAIHNYFGHDVAELWVDEARGNCRFRVPNGDIGLFQTITANFAGKIAEDRARGFSDEKEWLASGDYAQAFDNALRLSAGDKVAARLLLKWAERRTELLVTKLWARVEELAYALLDRRKLSGCEIQTLLTNGAQRDGIS